jgi:putative copper export protein
LKKLTFIIAAVLTMATTAPANWFDNGEKERRIETEQQLQVERHTNSNLSIAVIILAISSVCLLTVGAAIGSKVRTDAKKS